MTQSLRSKQKPFTKCPLKPQDLNLHAQASKPMIDPQVSTCRNVDDTIIAGPGFDQEELGKWHRTEQEKEEAREQMQRATHPRPTLLGKGARKCWAVSEILEEMVELRPTDDMSNANVTGCIIHKYHWTIDRDLVGNTNERKHANRKRKILLALTK
ncbi:hypothetical protein EDD85DRAFT_791017 [Armillaria nabsnona]|nr:hypothetical protein EDD85DRAFT_791017 [Armillaria nabsnona]